MGSSQTMAEAPTEEMAEQQFAIMKEHMPPGIDYEKVIGLAEEMLAKADADHSGTIDRDEAIAFMKDLMLNQFGQMVESMPEMKAMAPEELEKQKAAMVEGMDDAVDDMSSDMPFPWTHNIAMMFFVSHAMQAIMVENDGMRRDGTVMDPSQ